MTTGTYEYKSDFARRYFSQGEAMGEAKGEANALLTLLAARGIEVPDDARTKSPSAPTWTSSTAGSAGRLPPPRSPTCSTEPGP